MVAPEWWHEDQVAGHDLQALAGGGEPGQIVEGQMQAEDAVIPRHRLHGKLCGEQLMVLCPEEGKQEDEAILEEERGRRPSFHMTSPHIG